jgi:hypothetical protein
LGWEFGKGLTYKSPMTSIITHTTQVIGWALAQLMFTF